MGFGALTGSQPKVIVHRRVVEQKVNTETRPRREMAPTHPWPFMSTLYGSKKDEPK